MRILSVALSSILVALLCRTTPCQPQLPELQTIMEGLDGMQLDLCGPVDARNGPDLLRVWKAQGRRRAAIQIDTRERQFIEEAKDFLSRLVAVELDETNDRLLTLTDRSLGLDAVGTPVVKADAALRLDNVFSPSAPLLLDEVTFAGLEVKDIRIINPVARTVLVTFPNQLRVYGYANDSFVELTPAGGVPLVPSSFPPVSCGTFAFMRSAEIHRLHNGTEERTLAFVETMMNHPGFTNHSRATGIVVCDVTNPGTAAFLTGTNQTFDPVPPAACPTLTGLGVHWAIEDFVLLQDGAQHLLYAAGGSNFQLRKIDVTNILTTGFGTPTLVAQGPFSAVAADKSLPVAGADYLYAVLVGGAIYAINRANPSLIGFSLTDTGNEAPERDVLLMLEGNDRRKLWTLFREAVDYKWKITDVTQPLPPALPVDPGPIEGRYASGGADGGIAILDWEQVWIPNFGGVVPWDLSGEEPQPVYESYRPAVDPTGKSLVVEALEFFEFGSPTDHDRWLFASTAQGSFIAWPLSDTPPHDPPPGPPSFFEPPNPATYWPSTWNLITDVLYGSDVGVGVDPTNQHRIVVFDYYNKTTEDIAIGRYDWTAGAWLPPAVLDASTGVVADSRDVSAHGGWAFVSAEHGFFVVNLATGAVDDQVVTYTGEGLPGDVCGHAVTIIEGIGAWQDRVFISLRDDERTNPDRFGVAAFEFTVDPVSGVGSFGPAQICLFDGAGGPTDPWPDHYLTGGGRLRLAQVDAGVVRIYAATGTGVLVELEYLRTPTSETLTPLATWSNDRYFGVLADCPVYLVGEETSSFGPGVPDVNIRILVSKWQESWALVEGSPYP